MEIVADVKHVIIGKYIIYVKSPHATVSARQAWSSTNEPHHLIQYQARRDHPAGVEAPVALSLSGHAPVTVVGDAGIGTDVGAGTGTGAVAEVRGLLVDVPI
jgi:hypothetical protein